MTSFRLGENMQEHNELAHTDNNQTDTTSFQPMGFTDILDGMFSIYGRHLRLFLGIALVYFLIVFVLDLISIYFVTSDLLGANVVIDVFTGICSFVVSILVGAALTYASGRVYLGMDATPRDASAQAGLRFWSYAGSTILWFLAVGGLFITVIGIPFSIYFAVRWSLYGLPVMFENAKARNALGRSTELVKGSWWRAFGIMAAIFLISFMIVFILRVSCEFILSSMGIIEIEKAANFPETLRRLFVPTLDKDEWFSDTVQRFVSQAITALTMPLIYIGTALLYFDLRIRKEDFGAERQGTD